MSRLALFFALTLLFISPPASADIPHLISLQGRLTDATNNPLTSTANFVFRIYASPTGGTPVWTETQNSIPLDTIGIFSVLLGSATALSIPFDSSYWLEVQVQSGTGPAQILSPRQRMGSAGYALRSESPWNTTGNNIYTTNAGNVGIGTTNPGAKLDVNGKIKIGNDTLSPVAGMIRYSGGQFEGYNGVAWVSFAGSALGNTGTVVLADHLLNAKDVIADIFLPGNSCAATANYCYTDGSTTNSYCRSSTGVVSNLGGNKYRISLALPQPATHVSVSYNC